MNMKEYLYSNKPYIIAETAYSFEGDKNYLLQQILNLTDKVDAIKFHILIDIDEYMVASHPVYDSVKSWILSEKDWKEILIKAKKKKIDTVILVDDNESVNFCKKNHELVDAIEIHAACVNDLMLLDKAIEFVKKYNKVFIIGISGFEIQELQNIAEYLLKKELRDVLMMYGFQNYPTNIRDINLSKISILENILQYKIGYADHTTFSDILKEQLILTSFALGANIQEIHYVLDEGVERTDYSTAIDINRFDAIKRYIEDIYCAIGNKDFRLNEGEEKYLNFRKVPVYLKDVQKGQIFDANSVSFKRVGTPLRQNKFRDIEYYYGKKIANDVFKNNEIIFSDFEGEN